MSPPRTFHLRQLRVNRSLSQETMARRAGLPLERYRRLENDELAEWSGLSLHTLLRVASLLEVRPVDLYPRLAQLEVASPEEPANVPG